MLNTTAPLIDEWGLQVLPEFELESLESRARFRRLFVGCRPSAIARSEA